NTEAALWFSTKEKPDDLLDESDLGLEKIDPAKFKAGAEQEPCDERQTIGDIVLDSAILLESGLLECQVKVPASVQSLTLTVRNINEALPVFSIPVQRVIQGKASVEFDENQIAQIRSAAICALKGSLKSGQDSISNAVALVQLYQLLRESPTHLG